MSKQEKLSDAKPKSKRKPAPFINQQRAADGTICDLPDTFTDTISAEKFQYKLGAGSFRAIQIKGKWRTFKAVEQPMLFILDDGAPEKTKPAEDGGAA